MEKQKKIEKDREMKIKQEEVVNLNENTSDEDTTTV